MNRRNATVVSKLNWRDARKILWRDATVDSKLNWRDAAADRKSGWRDATVDSKLNWRDARKKFWRDATVDSKLNWRDAAADRKLDWRDATADSKLNWRGARKIFWRDATVDRKRRRFDHGVGKRRRGHGVLTPDMYDGPDGVGQAGEGRLRTIDANCDDCARRLRWLAAGDGVLGERRLPNRALVVMCIEEASMLGLHQVRLAE